MRVWYIDMSTVKNYSTVMEFIEDKFKDLGQAMTMVTSLDTTYSIKGKNWVKVLANTEGLSGLIRSVNPYVAIKVLSESSPKYASIVILQYHPATYDSGGWTTGPSLPLFSVSTKKQKTST